MRPVFNISLALVLGAALLAVSTSVAPSQVVIGSGNSVDVDLSAIDKLAPSAAADFLRLPRGVNPRTSGLRQPLPQAPGSVLHVAPEPSPSLELPQNPDPDPRPSTSVTPQSPPKTRPLPPPPTTQAPPPPAVESTEVKLPPPAPPAPVEQPQASNEETGPTLSAAGEAEQDETVPTPKAAPSGAVTRGSKIPDPVSVAAQETDNPAETPEVIEPSEQTVELSENAFPEQLVVLFDAGSTELLTEATDLLNDFMEEIVGGNGQIQIRAFAGGGNLSASKARRISLYRALVIHKYLVEGGVASNRINVRALGNRTNDQPINRAEISVTKP